ncbi:MAG: hypothetical protein OXB84_07510 [Halobacteriovoraceae bacterium]|nr:hypothetical protein [Halobacteriovoraceae bacterium]
MKLSKLVILFTFILNEVNCVYAGGVRFEDVEFDTSVTLSQKMPLCSGLLQTIPDTGSQEEAASALFLPVDCDPAFEYELQSYIERQNIEVRNIRLFLKGLLGGDYDLLSNVIMVNGIPFRTWVFSASDEIRELFASEVEREQEQGVGTEKTNEQKKIDEIRNLRRDVNKGFKNIYILFTILFIYHLIKTISR